MSDNISQFRRQQEAPKAPPTFKYEVFPAAYLYEEGQDYMKPFVAEGFLTVMGDYFFIGRALDDGEIAWVFAAPKEQIQMIRRVDGLILTHDA
jgi:hypothetical protein